MERSKQVSRSSRPLGTSSTTPAPPFHRTLSATCRRLSVTVVLLALTCGLASAAADAPLVSRTTNGNRTAAHQHHLPATNKSERRLPSLLAKASPALPLGGAAEARDKMLKSSKDALIVTKKSYLKKDWCKTEPLNQRVREAGCVTRTIVNRFCYGQCNSFYIPKNAKADMDATAFKSCSFCKPKHFRWIAITLRCPGRHPPYKRKRIQRIKKCKCISEILQ